MPDRPDTPKFSASLEDYLREQVPEERARRRRRRRLPAIAASSGLSVIAVVALVATGLNQSAREAQATAFVLDGKVVAIEDLVDPSAHRRLQDRFADAGGQLVIKRRPVASSAVGRVFSVDYPKGARVDGQGRLNVQPGMGGPVTVTVGVPSQTPTTAGQTIYQALPDLCSLVTPTDAPATVEALRNAGYRVDVKQITFTSPGARARDVQDPPGGTLVIGVLNAKGTSLDVSPETKHLIVEVGTGGDGHHGQTDGACAPPKQAPRQDIQPENLPPREQRKVPSPDPKPKASGEVMRNAS